MRGVDDGRPVTRRLPRPGGAHLAPAAATFLTAVAALALALSLAGLPPAPGSTQSPGTASSPGQTDVPGSTHDPDGTPGATPGSSEPGSTPGPDETPDPSAPAGAWAPVELPALPRVARLEPTLAVAAGVLAETAFRLTSLDGTDPATLASRLAADPPLDLRVTGTDAGAAIVQSTSPLRAGQRYRLALRDPDGTVRGTWTVRTVGPLQVVSTVPAHQSTNVPLDTGIEVTFDQDGVSLDDAQRFIELVPAVEGSWVQQGRTVAFVPAKPLHRGTLYTLTVRHGLPLAGTPMTLERDVVVAFETADEAAPKTWVTLRHQLIETPVGEGAVVAVNLDELEEETGTDPRPTKVDATVHRLADMNAAIDAWDAIRRAPDWTSHVGTAPVATGSLSQVVDGTFALHRFDPEVDWRMWFRLPSLSAGWYLLTMREHGVARQAVIQVTDIAVYAAASRTHTIAWVNDLATRAPLLGAKVAYAGSTLGTTTAEGIVFTDTPAVLLDPAEDASGAVLTVRLSGRGAFVPLGVTGECEKCGPGAWGSTSPWWQLLQPDRYAYRPTDTINAWGVIRERGSLHVPASVTVRLVDEWMADDPAVIPVVAQDRAPDDSGAFLADLRFEDLPYGSYRLQVLVDGNVVNERSIEIDRIVKPAWTIAIRTSRNALVERETVRVFADARFFEGTPVSGARLRFTGGTATRGGTTSLLGRTSAPLRMGAADEESGQWDVRTLVVRPANPEEGSIRAETEVAVFQANVLVRVERSLSGGRLTATGSVHRVAWSRYEGVDAQDLWSVDPFGAAVPGRSVRIRVVEHHAVKQQTGTRYDFITKRTVPVWTWDDRTSVILDRVVRTDDMGRFRLGLDVTTTNRDFEIIATAADATGRKTVERAWASTIGGDEVMDAAIVRDDGADDGSNLYEVGDTVRLRFQRGSGTGTGGTYLWTIAQAGIRTWQLTDGSRFHTTFTAARVPSISVGAVRFTGTGYEVAREPYLAMFDPSDRSLRVTVTPDAARYAPGDTARLSIRTRAADGTPVAASVLVRVVDEKLYAMHLAGDEDPLTTLYEPLGAGIIATGWTHAFDTDWGDGWGDTTGGGGDGRSDFRDWLLATMVRTGADGRGSVTVKLSDDLTSWRVTAAGVTTALHAGMTTHLLPVGLPFFAEATIAPEYLAADRPVIALRGFGSALRGDDRVTFTVSSDTLPLAPVTVRARAFVPAEVALPKLSVGTHRVRIVATVKTGATTRTDTLTRTFTVVAARQLRSVTTTVALTGATPVERGTGPTTLIVADAGRGRVVPILEELRWADPSRADTALAAALATRLMRVELGLDVPDTTSLQGDLGRFSESGSISVVPWSSGELELTVLAALADDERLPAASLAGAFLPSDEEDPENAEPVVLTPEREAWTLAGLAATGATVTADIRAMAARDGLSVPTRVALAIAAFAAGDEELAGDLERGVLTDAGRRLGPWVSVHGPDGPDAVLTARLAIVAASLGDPLAADLDAFVAANPPAATVVDLERALAARGWLARVPAADASAVLVVGNVRTTLEIDASQPRLVSLTPAQAKVARLEPGTGSVVVTTTTMTPYRAGTLERPDDVTLSVLVTPGMSVAARDLVTVTYTVTLPRRPDGCWTLTDMVPSGLIPLGGGGATDEGEDEEGSSGPNIATPDSVTGQAVRFCLAADPERAVTTLRARYLARVVTPGRYRWEPAVLQSSLAPELGVTTPARTFVIGRQTR